MEDIADFAAFVLHVNREDLLRQAIESAQDFVPNLSVVDNSQAGLSLAAGPGLEFERIRPSVPLSFAQSMNFAMAQAKSTGARICITMHSDAVAGPGSCLRLLQKAQEHSQNGRKWGVLFTSYDALVALNVALLDAVGPWDTNLPWYFSDNDYYQRVRLAGFECLETNLPVDHRPSQTLKSDPELRFLNGITFPLYESYYRSKWGGKPGQECFRRPFNR